jgi:hypothetical protein
VADDNIIETCRREAQAWINAGIGDGWPLTQAAAAIEAQQAEIERLRAERDAERVLADRLVHLLSCFHLSQRCRVPQGTALEDWCSECAAIAAYEEARRG